MYVRGNSFKSISYVPANNEKEAREFFEKNKVFYDEKNGFRHHSIDRISEIIVPGYELVFISLEDKVKNF